MALVTPRENFFDRNGAGLFPKFLEVLKSLIDFLLPNVRLRNDPSDGLPVPSDDDRLTAFHLVEQSGKMGLGFGGLDFSRHIGSTGQSDRLV
jgi:hypothetical protein